MTPTRPPPALHVPAVARPAPRWRTPACQAAERAGRRGDWTWDGEHEGARVATVGRGVRRCFVYGANLAEDSVTGTAAGAVRIYHPGRRAPVQKLEIGDASSGSPLHLADLDFDGYQDLALLSLNSMHNQSYRFYRYDPRHGAFDYWRDDNALNPDPKRRVLTQYQHGSCCSGTEYTFRWAGRGPKADLVLIEQEDHAPNARRGGTDYVRRARRNRRMVVVKRWHEAPPPGER